MQSSSGAFHWNFLRVTTTQIAGVFVEIGIGMIADILTVAVIISVYAINISLGETDDGYFDILPGRDVQAIVSGDGSELKSTETGSFRCLSKCLYTTGCWAVKMTAVTSPSNRKTVVCVYYTLAQPLSNLKEDESSKLAIRRWGQGFSVEERLSGTCGVYLLTYENLVPDENFSCSSWVYQNQGWVQHVAKYGRYDNMDRGAGAWCASQNIQGPEWIQVYLGRVRQVTGVVTQGRAKDNENKWVRTYTIALSNDGSNWYSYPVNSQKRIFQGNFDQSTPVVNQLDSPVYAAYVRIYPLLYNDWTCLRFDVLGC